MRLSSISETSLKFWEEHISAVERRLLQKMGQDHDRSWQALRERFEEFPPNEERKTPSEC
jgi:hypothetical protein